MKSGVKQYKVLLQTDRVEAKGYYDEVLFPVVCENFCAKVAEAHKEKRMGKYEYLIMSVGFTIEPLIMWIKALKPKKVYFICSTETEDLVNDICEIAGLKHTQTSYDIVESSDGIDVYQKINDYVNKHKLRHDLKKVAIDITGGKKSTVSGCSSAANHLGIDILYVDYHQYFTDERKPIPGTECPVILEDPLEVFGDRELNRGIFKFNSEDFDTASEIFASIKERANNPRPYEAYENLAIGYGHLESMHFELAHKHLQRAIDLAERNDIFEIPIRDIRIQLDVIKPLINIHLNTEHEILSDEHLFWHLYAYMFAMADHYYIGKKYDIAAMLMYRCFEMISQRLLNVRGINTSSASYSHIDEDLLLEKVNEKSAEIYPDYRPLQDLPKKIGLMQGYTILKSLNEPIVAQIDLEDLNNQSLLRNKSRLVHGFQLLEEGDVTGFYGRLKGITNKLWSSSDTHHLGRHFKDLWKKYSFLNIRKLH